ncbi:hypothetical protein RchiOBHm_Chr6g0268421 [Rosa chinensis]|uniref:Uncharacterized protein n=1 Tax=Rosa chinensis TaxID=74649 RepID=A0A2P6PQ77_ROSCH|nr:hypothetical protein RchiOBHm_Chr6g0268421 [Rosa chinensis]
MGDDTPAALGTGPEVSNGVAAAAERTPEELVAKSIAPVKKQFLRAPPVRPCSKDQNDAVCEGNAKPAQSNVVKEKKSKRQLKRERREVML